MSLQHLTTYVSQRCAAKAVTLYSLAGKFDSPEESVVALLRAERVPGTKMLRQLAAELDVRVEYLHEIAER